MEHLSNIENNGTAEAINSIVTKDFLTQFRAQGLLNLVAIEPDGSAIGATFEMPNQIEDAADWAVKQNGNGKNVYFTVNPVKKRISKKPGKLDIEGAEYAHVDIDPDTGVSYEEGRARLLETTVPELQGFDPAPSFIVDSGNGLAAFWRLDDASIEQAEKINKQLIQRFGGDAGTHNIDRLMRLPGTLNYPNKRKLSKGYPEAPGLSKVLASRTVTCSVEQLAAVLPELETGRASIAPRTYNASPGFAEDTSPLLQEEIDFLAARLDTAVENSLSLQRRWHGEIHGLKDTSRSGLDFSVTALLKMSGFTYRETAHLVKCSFKYGKGSGNTDRDLERNWTRCGTTALDEIVSLCTEAKARGDSWEAILYAARPNAQTVDGVLDDLSTQDGFAGKRVLKEDYFAYVEKVKDREAEEQIRKQAENRLALLWDPTNLNDMVDRAEDALRTIPGKWEVLLYSGIHSRVAVKPPQHFHLADDPNTQAPSVPVLEPYSQQGMLLRIEQSVVFYGQKDGRAIQIAVPDRLPALILNKPDPSLPVTIGLVAHPLVLPNGAVLIEEGLHARSGIYANFGGASFEAPGTMTPEEAVAILRTEMLGEFEFATEADVAAGLALVLTAIERKTLDMAPGFMINASAQGSGKTTLARMAHLLVTGHDMPVAAMSENVEEQNKELTAMLMASVPIVCFDNVPDAFKVASPVLARALTSPTHTGRILGMSKMAELPTNTVFVVTGNNITADVDLSRRLLEVRLAPKEERPEQRRFQHPDVVGYVLSNRSHWMQAALTILSGSRESRLGAPPSGFHQWDCMVRWPLVNAGVTDPVTKFDEVRENSPDHERMTAWILGLAHGFGVGKAFCARDLMILESMSGLSKQAQTDPSGMIMMYVEYLSDHPPPKGWGSVNSLGWMLNRLVGRTIEGYALTKKTVRGIAHYVVERR
jgi:hypothetical protein